MKPMNLKINSMFSMSNNKSVGDGGSPNVADLEVRPGGMLVQKREMNGGSQSIPTIKVRVKYGSSYREIRISSQASFGNKNSWHFCSLFEQLFWFEFSIERIF
jgi:hypothetical protein